MIIAFYDNEGHDYPLIKIKDEDYNKFETLLKDYQKEEDYNFDDFLALLEENLIGYDPIQEDKTIFF